MKSINSNSCLKENLAISDFLPPPADNGTRVVLHWDERCCQHVRVPGSKSRRACAGVRVCAGAAAWLVSGPLTTLSLFHRERFHRRSLAEPFTAMAENSQKQEAGQAGAAWPRAAPSLPASRKAARSSCAVIWSHARANLHFQRWNQRAEAGEKRRGRGAKSYIITALAHLVLGLQDEGQTMDPVTDSSRKP